MGALRLKGTKDNKTAVAAPTGSVQKTASQMAFERAQTIRLSKKPSLARSHKERVEDFNRYLSKLSDHYDVPKVGPG